MERPTSSGYEYVLHLHFFYAPHAVYLQNTHVVELFSRLAKDKRQLTYYNSGIGTYVKSSNTAELIIQDLVNKWDMAVAWCVCMSTTEYS